MNDTTYDAAERDRISDVIARVTDMLEMDGVVLPTRGARHALRNALDTMYQSGRHDQRGELLAPEHVAQVFGFSTGRLRQIAREYDLGIRIGSTRVYTQRDIARLADIRNES